MSRFICSVLETKEKHDFNSKISSGSSSLGNAMLMKPIFCSIKTDLLYHRVSSRGGIIVYISLSLSLSFLTWGSK